MGRFGILRIHLKAIRFRTLDRLIDLWLFAVPVFIGTGTVVASLWFWLWLFGLLPHV